MNWHALSWIINEECNLNCLHCYPSSGTNKKTALSSTNLAIIKQNMMSMHFDKVYISGGEPLLCQNLDAYFQIASCIGDRLYICTNSLCIDDSKLQLLEKYNVKITISLQHTNEIKGASLYGDISIAKAIKERITRLRNSGVPIKLEVTVMRVNHQELHEFFEFAAGIGITEIDFKRYRPVGRGKMSADRFALTPDENEKALRLIYSLSRQYKDIEASTDDPLFGVVIRQMLLEEGKTRKTIEDYLSSGPEYGCKAGRRWIGLAPNGDVAPCPLLLYSGITIGSVLSSSMADIIQSSEMIQIFQENRCNGCADSRICGGCRVCAYAQTGDIYDIDPMCRFSDRRSDNLCLN